MSILLISMSCTTANGNLAKEKALEMYPLEKPFSNSKFVYVDGVRLHIRRWFAENSETEKGTVLLIHGISGSSYNWRFLAPELALNGWNVLSIDIPPFGFSGEKQKQGDSLDPLQKDSISRASLVWDAVDSILDERSGPLVILGHSLGGRIAAHMTLTRPQDVAKLILIAPAVFGKSTIPQITKYWPFKVIVQNSSPLVLENKNVVRYIMSRAYGRDVTDDEFIGNWVPYLRPGVPTACGEWAVESIDTEEPPMGDIDTQTLILWAKKDKIVPNKGKQLQSEMRNSYYIEVKCKSHCLMETHSEIVNEEILRFLAL